LEQGKDITEKKKIQREKRREKKLTRSIGLARNEQLDKQKGSELSHKVERKIISRLYEFTVIGNQELPYCKMES
jgi:hypothetical protein